MYIYISISCSVLCIYIWSLSSPALCVQVSARSSSSESCNYRKPGTVAEAAETETAAPAGKTTGETAKSKADSKEPEQAVQQGGEKKDGQEAKPREAARSKEQKKSRGGTRCNSHRADRVECR